MTTDALFPSPAASTIWGKTGIHSRTSTATDWHPLLAHMLDTMHVADHLWEHYLAPSLRDRFSAGLSGPGTPSGDAAGRAAFRWLAALHDIGKATPGFQSLSTDRFPPVLRLLPLSVNHEPVRHELSSAQLVRMFLEEESWKPASIDWVANVVGGHHGSFPPPGFAHSPRTQTRLGGGNWREVQREFFSVATRRSGVDLASLSASEPGIGAQMAIAGAVILADWLASDDGLFGHCNGWPSDYPDDSARIAARLRRAEEPGAAWRPDPPADARSLYASRFAIAEPRAVQHLAHDVAARAASPGLMVIEAPTGEGKTAAGLAAAEVLAARFGCNGLFFALPDQATPCQAADRILDRWLNAQGPRPAVGPAHGRAHGRTRHEEPLSAIGESEADARAASTWLRGAKRALLAPVVVGGIDQLLYAAVSAKHVMLRHTCLAGKAVVIDEVHACDPYPPAVLHRVLQWLGRHGVPVVLLSAALPEEQRAGLLTAYAGAPADTDTAAITGYPRVAWAPAPGAGRGEGSGAGDRPAHRTQPVRILAAEPARRTRPAVEFAPETGDDAQHAADLVSGLVAAGSDPDDPTAAAAGQGCVLVLRNTVERAQSAFGALSARFPGEVTLVHAAFTAADRVRLDADLSRRFGPPRSDPATGTPHEDPHRPQRHIVVATQVAEQSLDIDFDVLVTDLAPIDLLLQRAGRCHRHTRPGARPAGLEEPRVIITGFRDDTATAPPLFPTGDGDPYPHHLLLRTLARLRPENGADRVRVAVPADVLGLIESVYGTGPLGPEPWRPAMAAAAASAERERARLAELAGTVLIARPDDDPEVCTLSRVQQRGGEHEADDEEQAAQGLPVRHGAPSIEVLLLRRTGDSTAETVSLPADGGRPLVVPLAGMPTDDQKEAILGQAIRLPADLIDHTSLVSPRGWRRAPWCSELRVLFLDPKSDEAHHGGRTYRYSPHTGWQETA